MNKKVLIISASPRKGGNSETLAAAFAKGVQAAGNQVETVYLREKQIGFCKGCFACLKLGHCVIQDDAVEIAAKMHNANVLVFATPVYYYCVSGQLKTMLDRANPLFDTDYAFTKAYLLATAAEDEPETFAGTEKAMQGWVDCFPRCALVGTVFAGGVNGVGEIAGHPALEQAYITYVGWRQQWKCFDSNGFPDGTSASVFQADDYNPADPEYRVRYWDKEGNYTDTMVKVNDIDPQNASYGI